MGIDIFVNLNTSKREIDVERRQVESRAMRYVSIPWSAFSEPTDAQVVEFLRLLRDNPDKSIFVHCQHGADRTGVMVAIFRMTSQGWTPEQALAEMEQFKFHGLLFRHLARYVKQFPDKLRTTPTLLGDFLPTETRSTDGNRTVPQY